MNFPIKVGFECTTCCVWMPRYNRTVPQLTSQFEGLLNNKRVRSNEVSGSEIHLGTFFTRAFERAYPKQLQQSVTLVVGILSSPQRALHRTKIAMCQQLLQGAAITKKFEISKASQSSHLHVCHGIGTIPVYTRLSRRRKKSKTMTSQHSLEENATQTNMVIIQKTVILGGGKDGMQNVFVHETIIS